ncbi:MAG: DUF3488 domain-containing protein, partial [Pseudolysinimonas sp.]
MALTDIRRATPSPARRPSAVPAAARTGGRPPVPHRPHAWRRMFLLAGTLIISLTGLHVALTGSSWWIVGAVFLLLTLITTTLVRQLTHPVWLPTAAGALVGLLGLTVGYGADTALLGIIPSPETVTRFVQLTNNAWGEIAVQSLPSTPELSIVFLIAISSIGLALIGDLALRIAPALTALPILTLLVIPVAIRPDLAEPYWYILAAIGYLILLRIGRRRATGATVVLIGAMVIVGSFLVSSVFPSVGQAPEQTTSGGVSTGINPLINLGDDLRRGAPVTAVSYATSDDQAVYLRLATLDTFDGRSWSPTLVGPGSKNTLATFPRPVGLTTGVKQSKVTAAVTVGNIQGNWLPVPYPTTKVTGATGTWFWEADGLSVRSTNASIQGQTYLASFLDVQPDLAQLRSTSTNQTVSKSYLGLPSRLPSIITTTAESVAGSATTEYDK